MWSVCEGFENVFYNDINPVGTRVGMEYWGMEKLLLVRGF